VKAPSASDDPDAPLLVSWPAFIEAEGSSIPEFYQQIKLVRGHLLSPLLEASAHAPAHCRQKQRSEEDTWSEESIFAQILVATTEFDIFMAMMKEAAEKRRLGTK
jgi:hypothetical protein